MGTSRILAAMMKNTYFLRQNFFLLFLLLSSNIAAQKKNVWSIDFFAQTIDVIVWDNVEYMMSQSPLSNFTGYKSIFGDFFTEKYNTEAPVILDKNYQAKWTLKDNKLFLNDVEIFYGGECYSDKRIPLEKLTNCKFNLDINPLCSISQFPEGLLFASWFSGFIYIKRQPEHGETYCDCMYQCERYKELGFRNGRLIHQDTVVFMDVFLDSIEIYNNSKNYTISQESIFRNSNCVNILQDKPVINDDQSLWNSFFGQTSDELFFNDSLFMCSESPLSILNNYKNIFPNIDFILWQGSLPRIQDKNYTAKWTIVNNMLYLFDVSFFGNENNINEFANRLPIVENLIGKKFVQIPSFNQKAILADWFCGTLYLKRFPVGNERGTECTYKCEPFYKLIIEKGNIKSIENTTYMILERNNQ